MPSVYDNLFEWARKKTSSFVELLVLPERDDRATPESADGLIYRLRLWPKLPAECKTADVYRMLSVMSSRPVNRRWMLGHCELDETGVDRLLSRLVAAQAVEVIDASKFRAADTIA